MLYDSYFRKPEDAALFLEKIRKYADQTGPIRLMEICGTHTMAIARSGLKSIRIMYNCSPALAARSVSPLPV